MPKSVKPLKPEVPSTQTEIYAMPHYLDCPMNFGKAAYAESHLGAKRLYEPPRDWSQVGPNHSLICVIDNIFYEAAAIITNASDLNLCLRPCGRRKEWLLIDRMAALHQSHFGQK